MFEDINFSSINLVLSTWEQARDRAGGDEQFGISVLLRLFEMDADVKGVFGVSHVPNNKFVGIQRMAILIHGQRIIDMIGSALSLLGPDSELIEEYLSTLGPRHLKYKIKASHFQSLGKALRDVIKGSLRESWTNSIDEAWKVVFDEMVSAITKPIIAPTTPLDTTSLIKSKTQRNPAA